MKCAVQSKVRFVRLLHTYSEILLGARSKNSDVTNALKRQWFWKEVHTLPPPSWIHRTCSSSG